MYKKLWTTIVILALIIIGMAYKFIIQGSTHPGDDGRMAVELTASERTLVLSEMRLFLETIQQVTAAMGNNALPQAAPALKRVGSAARGNIPASLMAKLPISFKQLGFDTHAQFDALAEFAASGDQAQATQKLGQLLTNCIACHAAYQIEVSE
jgi:hypothetical protein